MKPSETHHYRGVSRTLLFDYALAGDLQDTVLSVVKHAGWSTIKQADQ